MGTHRLVRRSSSSSSVNNNSNNNGKVVVPVLVKVPRGRRSRMASPNDGDARWRETERGMTFIILAGNQYSSCAFARPHLFLSFRLFLSYARKQVSLLFLWIALYPCSSLPLFHLACVLASNRVCLILPSFCLYLSLYLSPTLIVTHHKHVGLVLSHICTTKSIIVYIMFRFAFFPSVFTFFWCCRSVRDRQINTRSTTHSFL